MKRIVSILVLALMLVTSLATVSSADAFNVVPNSLIKVPYSTPVVDGNIDPLSEGYSDRADLSNTTCGHFWAHNPMSSQADLYYAFDDEGIYVAANVVEGLEAIDPRDGQDYTGWNQFNYSTGLDDLDIDAETGLNKYGWNGDVMGIMFDPFGGFLAENFTGGSDHSAWYMVGLFEGDVARVYKSHTSTDGEITDQVQAAGHKTENGWCFEIMITWDMILADTDDCSFGMVSLDKETLVQDGTYIRVGAMYHDRFFDEEQGGLGTWGRYIVVPETLADGSPGPGGIGDNIASYGIEIELDMGESIVFEDVPEDAWYNKAVYYCADKGYITGTSVEPALFSPDGKLTREQFVTILARVAGADLSAYTETTFKDVKVDTWYGPSVIWAAAEGYVLGIGDGANFGVGQNMTREQLATMFFRYAEAAGLDVEGKADLSTYTDVAQISNWASDACAWAVNAGLLNSTDSKVKTLAPKMTVTRAQAAQIFMNYDNI